MNRFGLLWLTIFIFVLFSSCTTTKKSRSDTGFIGKKYHDLTAKYNGYFNAVELYKASLLQLDENYVDNYNRLLDIYTYNSIKDRSVVEGDMDKAIEKVTKVAALHEVSKWVDDCYVLMGKAQYLKGDYESAQETFEYFIIDFNPRDPDSRVYVSKDTNQSSKERRKEVERERKIVQDKRKEVKKEKEKTRKQKAKERKKDKKQREKERKERNKARRKKTNKRTSVVAQETKDAANNDAIEEGTNSKEISNAEDLASIDNEVPIQSDSERFRIDSEKKKKREKEIEKQTSGGFLKHKPAYYEGMLWLCKTYISREKWLDAKYYLDKIENDPGVPEEVAREVPVVRADLLIGQKNYEATLPVLEQALESTKDKKFQARLAFIRAQIFQLTGNANAAYAAFDQVNDYKPSFEMSLNAKLNQMRNAWASGSESSDGMISKLEKMAREDKNKLYLGAIYFTIAEIQLADGDEDLALDYFSKALKNSKGSGNKLESYYRLATLFLGREKYLLSKTYFDSTLTLLPEIDERYPNAKRYSNNLRSIAKNLTIVQNQDSLLKLGNLSEEDLRIYALNIAKKNLEEEVEEKEVGGFTSTTTILSGNSKFFAYNPVAIQRGKKDFAKRWGDRPLEDNWRRSNKTSSSFDIEPTEEEVIAISEELLEKEISKITRDVPRTEEEKKLIEASVEKALFELGTGYRTYIDNYIKSNETLLTFLSRYPDNTHRVEAYYYIYLNFLDLNKNEKADTYLQKILNEFPDSDYAKYLRDPSGDNVLMTEERRIEVYYRQTYDLFNESKYQEAFDRLENAKEVFGVKHRMVAKFELLKAMCIGNLMGQEEYINALRGVILRYDNTPEQIHAREMMRFLRGDEEAFGGEVTSENLEKFVVADSKLHYIVIILYEVSGNDINEVKKQINSYNEKYFKSDRLRSTSIFLNQDNKTHLVLIRRFQNREKSMTYFKSSDERKKEFIDPEKFSYEVYSINQKNYREVIKEKSIKSYRVFFDNHYLTN